VVRGRGLGLRVQGTGFRVQGLGVHASRALTPHCPRLIGRGQQLLHAPPPADNVAAQEEPPLHHNSPQSDDIRSPFAATAPAKRDGPYPVPTLEERLSRQASPVPQDPTSPLAQTGGGGLSAEDLQEPSPPWAAPTPQPRSTQQRTPPRPHRGRASLPSTRLELTCSRTLVRSSPERRPCRRRVELRELGVLHHDASQGLAAERPAAQRPRRRIERACRPSP